MLSKRHSRNFLFFTLEIFYFYFFYFIPKATSLYLSKAFIASWCTKKNKNKKPVSGIQCSKEKRSTFVSDNAAD